MTPKAKRENGMKTYFVSAEVIDGEHAHYSYATIKAKTEGSAIKKIDRVANYYFGYGDGLTGCKIREVLEVTPDELAVLEKFKIAYEMRPQ